SSYFKSKDQPETIVIPVPSKVDNKKDSTSYTNKVAPTTIKKETTKYSVKSEDQQFATPGTYKMLDKACSLFIQQLLSITSCSSCIVQKTIGEQNCCAVQSYILSFLSIQL
ncbi:hypothetical protein I4U23_007483, partial [Adineta vaga]